MNFNWGYKILFVYILFVAGIMFLVFQSSKQKIDLVTEDYYEQEIKYQERIEQMKRANALSEKVRVNVGEGTIDIFFPSEFHGLKVTGNATLYYPANEDMDLHALVKTDDAKFSMSIPGKHPGAHILKLNWESGGVSFYSELQLFLP